MANLAVFQLPDANALETADIVKAKIEELKKDFPEGIDYMIRYDTTPFIRESIQEVFKTLLDSVILVAMVVLCSSRTGGRRSSRWSPCRWRSSARSRSCWRWASA